MKQELKNEKIKCECGSWTKPQYFNLEGSKVRGSSCPKCGETYFNPEDANKALIYNRIKREILKGKVAKAGNSFVIRLPKKLIVALGLYVGEEIDISLVDPHKIMLQIPENV